MVCSKLSSKDLAIRTECTKTIKGLLRKDDNSLLDFKLQMLKELHKTIKQKNHIFFDSSLLDCLVLHEIMVDEIKAKVIDESSKKSQQMHDQMNKLRRKGKLREYKELKDQLMGELKETDAIGVDLANASKINNEIIKEVLNIYFNVLKN